MKPSIQQKLETFGERYEEIAALLSEPEVINDQNQFRKLSVEYSQLEPVVNEYAKYKQTLDDKETAEEMLDDPEMKEMAQEEIQDAKEKLGVYELSLQKLLLP